MRAFPSLYLFKVFSDIFKTVKKIYDNQSHFDQFLAEKQMKLHLLKGKKTGKLLMCQSFFIHKCVLFFKKKVHICTFVLSTLKNSLTCAV